MRRRWILPLPDGMACRWLVEGPSELHDFFDAIALGTGLELCDSDESVPSECRVTGLDASAWMRLKQPGVRTLERVLKVEWDDCAGSVNYLNLADLPAGPALMTLRRILILHGCVKFYLSGRAALFHGALFRLGNQGMVIAGRSGTGKSTCSRKVRSPWECWCDDSMLMIKIDSAYLARPMPTWSAFVAENSVITPLKSTDFLTIRKMVFLEQGLRDGFIPVTVNGAILGATPSVIDFIRCCGYAFPRELRYEMMRQGFAFAAGVAATVPAQRMVHTLPGRPWEFSEHFVHNIMI